MNVKRILLIGLILVAVGASLSIASANSSVKVGGIDFNIPEGYILNEPVSEECENTSYPTNDGFIPCISSYKEFSYGTDFINIRVVEFDSQDDAKNAQDYVEDMYNGTAKTLNGHDGIYGTLSGGCWFNYCQDKYFIGVTVSDESLLELVVPK